MTAHQIVVVDVPWTYYGDPNKNAAAGKHYVCMPDHEVLRIDVLSYLDPRRGLVLAWATCSRLDFAIEAMRSWGLHYRGVAFAWVKTRGDGTPVGAQGIRASITKPTIELLLAGSVKPRGRPLSIADEKVAQVFAEDEAIAALRAGPPLEAPDAEVVGAPRGEHSAKPAEVYARIERMYPQATKCELFARAERPGWTCIGDQLPTPSKVALRIIRWAAKDGR